MTTGPDDDTDVVKEIHSAKVPRVDAVAGPAHGLPFLLLKAADPAGQPTDLPPAVGPVLKASTAVADDQAPDMPTPDDLADAAGVDDLPGDPQEMPGSPAWEALDAATARAATGHLTALRRLVCGMQEREGEEVAAGHAEDVDDVMDLQQVLDALDCAVGVLARFAVTEQAEADGGAQDVEDEARALGLIKTLDQLPEALQKAGRVLSAANEASLRAAHAAITDVLGRVAPAPSEENDMQHDDSAPAEPVAKAADTEPTQAPAAEPADAEAPVTKADDLSGTSDADLKRMVLTGSAGERNKALMELGLRTLTGGAAPADPDGDGDAPAADASSDDAAPADAPAADQPAAAPAPDAAPAAPATNSDVPEPAPASDEDAVQKALSGLTERMHSIVQEAIQVAVTPLQKRLEAVEATPVPGPMLNGATPGADPAVLRGHDTSSDPFADVRKQLDAETDPQRRAALSTQLAAAQIKNILGR